MILRILVMLAALLIGLTAEVLLGVEPAFVVVPAFFSLFLIRQRR
jgi:hypothetical protein